MQIYYPRNLTKIDRERKRDLAELEGVLLAGELEVAGDENEHTGGGTRRLAVDGGDVVLALLERERCELGDDVLDSKDLLTFEGEHGSFLVETGEADTVVVEGRVVVLDEGLSHRIGIHLRHYRENERETETMRRMFLEFGSWKGFFFVFVFICETLRRSFFFFLFIFLF